MKRLIIPGYVESARRSGGWERAEHRAVLPGELGLECIFYQYLYYKTLYLRRAVYITFTTEGVEFRPAAFEHIPHSQFVHHQLRNAEQSYGKGRSLKVVFTAYSPEGSGAADLDTMRRHHEQLGEVPPELGFYAWWRRFFGRQGGRA